LNRHCLEYLTFLLSQAVQKPVSKKSRAADSESEISSWTKQEIWANANETSESL